MASDHERDPSLNLGEAALGRIKAHCVAALPRNYEIWYTYASGQDPRLSEALNTAMGREPALSQANLDAIFSLHFSRERVQDRLDVLGGQFLDQIETIVKTIDEAAGRASVFGNDLAGATSQLTSTVSAEALNTIIETLLRKTRAAEASNSTLKQRLQTSLREAYQLQVHIETVQTDAFLDSLTTLWNRRYYNKKIVNAVAEASTNKTAMSLVILDIDHFKRFNDTFGHLTGDQVLRIVGTYIKQNIKSQDLACRVGGEEFAIILPATSLKAATVVAEHMRRLVMSKELIKKSTGENLGRITLSFGVATLRADDTVTSLYDRADQCLYAAKQSGRNKVVCESDPEMSVRPPAAA